MHTHHVESSCKLDGSYGSFVFKTKPQLTPGVTDLDLKISVQEPMAKSSHAFLFTKIQMIRSLVLIYCALSASANICTLRTQAQIDVLPRRNISSVSPVNVSTALGPYSVKVGKIDHIPGLKFGAPHTGFIFYPEAKNTTEKFPLLSFAHGVFVGSIFPPSTTCYATSLEIVASYGFIVVGPNSCPAVNCLTEFAADQLATIKACKENPSLHPALASANFDIVGVFGHSMGGMATLGSAGGLAGHNPAEYNIKAAVSQHPCWDMTQLPGGVSIPIMFTAGSADIVCEDGCAEIDYAEVKTPKVLFNIEGAGHMEPTNLGKNREDTAAALFFSCWLRGENCNEVYGSTGKRICSQIQGGTLHECKVEGRKMSM